LRRHSGPARVSLVIVSNESTVTIGCSVAAPAGTKVAQVSNLLYRRASSLLLAHIASKALFNFQALPIGNRRRSWLETCATVQRTKNLRENDRFAHVCFHRALPLAQDSMQPVRQPFSFRLPALELRVPDVLEKFVRQLAGGNHLTDEDVCLSVEQLVDENVSAELKADFLCRLALKGETVGEIASFAAALRQKSIEPPLNTEWRNTHEILDVCGTGGDRLNTFNISTTVAIVCAAAGIPVAKHGNRAITSQAGSADVLEELGVKIDQDPEDAARSLSEQNFAFFFAPKYHPAFKHIGPARRLCADRGQRTIFNFLGPLLNPARPTAQLVGVPRPELCEPLARVLRSLGVRRGMVVSGKVNGAFLDEFSILGENTIAEFYQEQGFATSVMGISEFPLNAAALADLTGGDRKANAAIVKGLLRAEDRGAKRDAILLNAAAALFVANKTSSMMAGWDLAANVIDSGQAMRKLEELVA
jgi:anthranilate phosphoribosyltransferase